MFLSEALKFNIFDAIFYSLMAGFGESYFTAFSLALGHSVLFSGILSTLPLVVGGLIQLVSPLIYERVKSHKKIVVVGVIIQALTFLPLIYFSLKGGMSEITLFLLISIYWAFMLGLGPSWNVWQKNIIPLRVRTKFFSNRNILMYFFTLFGLFFGGVILDHFKKFSTPLVGFAALFLLSLLARLFSAYFLKRQPDEKKYIPLEKLNIKKILTLFSNDYIGKMLLFILVMRFSVFLSAPYFTSYMLTVMKLDYFWFTVIVSGSFIGRILVMRVLQKYLTKENNGRVMFLGAFGIALVPVLWTLSQKIPIIMCVEFFSGISWGLFDLTFFLLTFNDIPEERQPILLSTFNFIHTIVMALGTIIGGLIFQQFSDHYQGHVTIFTLSTVMRASSLLFFPGIILKMKRRVTRQVA